MMSVSVEEGHRKLIGGRGVESNFGKILQKLKIICIYSNIFKFKMIQFMLINTPFTLNVGLLILMFILKEI